MLTGSSHNYVEDPRNDSILIHISGELYPRGEAKVSVFDSGFLLGDGVWEGIRLHNGSLLFGREHLLRLYAGASAIDIKLDITPDELERLVLDTTLANDMLSGVHIRLIISRGLDKARHFLERIPAEAVLG